jgi:hypothetical protein
MGNIRVSKSSAPDKYEQKLKSNGEFISSIHNEWEADGDRYFEAMLFNKKGKIESLSLYENESLIKFENYITKGIVSKLECRTLIKNGIETREYGNPKSLM